MSTGKTRKIYFSVKFFTITACFAQNRRRRARGAVCRVRRVIKKDCYFALIFLRSRPWQENNYQRRGILRGMRDTIRVALSPLCGGGMEQTA